MDDLKFYASRSEQYRDDLLSLTLAPDAPGFDVVYKCLPVKTNQGYTYCLPGTKSKLG